MTREAPLLRTLDAAAARRWADLAVAALVAERDAIDRINVFPVADGDTGTNLVQTMRAAVEALDAADPDTLGGVLEALAKGALGGARGNSGVLLSQALRGVAEQLRDVVRADGRHLRAALGHAHDLAARAVSEPAEGTLLSVLRAAASCPDSERLDVVVRGATRAAVDALRGTTAQLRALSAAGVVDAGGRGLVVVLDALHAVVCDGERLAPDAPEPGGADGPQHESEFDYEVMYLLSQAAPDGVARLREVLSGLGDCVSVVGDGAGAWAVHVHCDDIGGAIEAGIETGRVRRIEVTRFADQDRAFPRERAVLACASSDALGELFAAEGADVLRTGPSPTAGELRDAIVATGAGHVVVLPNGDAAAAVAEQAAEAALRDGQEVVVVPTASPVQGLAALAVHDPGRRRADDQVAMAEAAAATRRGELRVADAEALTWVGRCSPGDVLGLVDGEVVLIGDEVAAAARELAERMLTTGGELVTALVHADAPAGLPDLLAEHLRRSHPEVEFAWYPGGDLGALVLFGLE